jgi:hypothetical protein
MPDLDQTFIALRTNLPSIGMDEVKRLVEIIML